MIQEVPSIPFMIDFDIPVVQVMCGDMFQGLLTAHGQVFTWGSNMFGQLGHQTEKVALVQKPKLVHFKDTSMSEKRNIFIKQISCGYNHCLALSDQNQVFVWGRRMGIYPDKIELTFHFLKEAGSLLNIEIHQNEPRLIKSNLIFYKFNKIIAGPYNSALITDSGEVLLQGINDFGQLGLPQEITGMVPFFPHFRKHDFFTERKQFVVDVAIGATTIYFVTNDKSDGSRHVYSMGCGLLGQLGDGSTLNKNSPIEITHMFDSPVVDIAAGGYHALALTDSGKVYGWGKKSKSQLGVKHRRGDQKFVTIPKLIEVGARVTEVHCGSLQSLAMTSVEN